MMPELEDFYRLVMRDALKEELNYGLRKGLPQDKIDLNIKVLKRKMEEEMGIPFSKATGGEIFKTGVGSLSTSMDEERAAPLGIEGMFDDAPSQEKRRTREEIDEEDREFEGRIRGRLAEEREKEFIRELEGRDFTQEMQDEQELRERERQMLEDSEREFLRGLNDVPPKLRELFERPEPEEPMFSIDTYTFDGREVPAITFKDGEILTFPEIDNLFRTYKTAPETNLGPETDRQVNEYLRQFNPTKEQFIRHFFLSRRLADGGEVETMGGIGTLNETAKNMFR